MKWMLYLLSFLSFFIIITEKGTDAAIIDVVSKSCGTAGTQYGWGSYFEWNMAGINEVSAMGIGDLIVGSAKINVEQSSASLEASTGLIESGYAYSKLQFRTIGSSYLNLSVNAFGASGISDGYVILEDYATHRTLFNLHVRDFNMVELYQAFPGTYSNGVYWDLPQNFDTSLIPLDSSYSYLLTVLATVGYSDQANAKVTISLVNLSEPYTIYLFFLSLIALLYVKNIEIINYFTI